MEFPVITDAQIAPDGENGRWLIKAGDKALRVGFSLEGAKKWSPKTEGIERTANAGTVTRLALSLDEPAKEVKVLTTFRP